VQTLPNFIEPCPVVASALAPAIKLPEPDALPAEPKMPMGTTDCLAERKSAPWKIALAVHLKHSIHASNRWLTDQLHRGSAFAVSQYVSAFHHPNSSDQLLIQAFTKKLKA
jgi:hypothetical protein